MIGIELLPELAEGNKPTLAKHARRNDRFGRFAGLTATLPCGVFKQLFV
jgi:hypothetical protein